MSRGQSKPAPLLHDATVAPVGVDDTDGARIYRRSLSFLLVTAAAELFPGVDVFIEHAAGCAAVAVVIICIVLSVTAVPTAIPAAAAAPE